MTAPTRRGPAPAGRPPTSAQQNAATAAEDTTDHHRDDVVQGAVVVLVDAAGTAIEVLEKKGPTYCAELALELLAPLRVLRAVVR